MDAWIQHAAGRGCARMHLWTSNALPAATQPRLLSRTAMAQFKQLCLASKSGPAFEVGSATAKAERAMRTVVPMKRIGIEYLEKRLPFIPAFLPPHSLLNTSTWASSMPSAPGSIPGAFSMVRALDFPSESLNQLGFVRWDSRIDYESTKFKRKI